MGTQLFVWVARLPVQGTSSQAELISMFNPGASCMVLWNDTVGSWESIMGEGWCLAGPKLHCLKNLTQICKISCR